jgi:hypothetical protein
MARILLSPDPAVRPVAIQAPKPGVMELAAVWLFCLVMTLGPVLFMLAVRG